MSKSKRPVVVGLDPSLCSFGVCAIVDGKQTTDTFTSEPVGEELVARLDRIHGLLTSVAKFVDTRRPALIIIEGYSFMRQRSRSLSGMIEIGAVLRWELSPNHQLLEVKPSLLKKFATGSGNADKHKVRMETFKRWKLEFPNGDECDAFVLAKIGEAMVSDAAFKKLTTPQREVLETLEG